MSTIQKISVVGCGKLGLCMAAVFAYRGQIVAAIDSNDEIITSINKRQVSLPEPGLQSILDSPIELNATKDYRVATGTDATFFVVPTPSNEDGSFSNRFLLSAISSVAAEVRKVGKRDHLFVVSSTTTPGSIDKEIIPLIKGTLGELPFQFCYNPEFIALGDAVNGLMNPDFVLIGELDEESGKSLSKFYRCFNSGRLIYRMPVLSAELCKIAVNCYVTMKISFANFIGMLCRRMGADAVKVLQAAGSDRRINHLCLSANGAYAGPCLPRDNRLMRYTAMQAGIDSPLSEATHRINERVKWSAANQALDATTKGSSVLVIGVGYKPGASIVIESTGFYIAAILLGHGRNVAIYDPHANLAGFQNVENIFQYFDKEKPEAIVLCHPVAFKLPNNIPVITP